MNVMLCNNIGFSDPVYEIQSRGDTCTSVNLLATALQLEQAPVNL